MLLSIFDEKYNICFLSALRDSSYANYRHRSGKFSVPARHFNRYAADVTREENWHLHSFHGKIEPGFPKYFAENFIFSYPPGNKLRVLRAKIENEDDIFRAHIIFPFLRVDRPEIFSLPSVWRVQ